VDVGDAQPLQVVELAEHPLQVAGQPVDIGGIAGHTRLLEPVGLEIAAQVLQLQRVGPRVPGLSQCLVQRGAELGEAGMVAVNPLQHRPEIVAAAFVAQIEQGVVGDGGAGRS
jgi:hypothetical protein